MLLRFKRKRFFLLWFISTLRVVLVIFSTLRSHLALFSAIRGCLTWVNTNLIAVLRPVCGWFCV